MGEVLGIDLGGTTIKAAVFSGNHLLDKIVIPSKAKLGREAIFKQLEQAITLLSAHHPHFERIGVISPGDIDSEAGICLKAINLKGWSGAPIKATLEAFAHVPVYVENDAVGSLLAEASSHPDVRRLVNLTFGTGLGGAVWSDGGVLASAKELGHLTLVKNGLLCGCGKRGCAELYLSVTALLNQARAIGLNVKNGRELVTLANEGHVLASQVMDAWSAALHAYLLLLEEQVHPDLIVLGGGLMSDPKGIGPWVKPGKTPIAYASFSNFSGAYGASLLPLTKK
jgi:glucokinase